jgi:hypothetical protein
MMPHTLDSSVAFATSKLSIRGEEVTASIPKCDLSSTSGCGSHPSGSGE